jgi:hypothetical protein
MGQHNGVSGVPLPQLGSGGWQALMHLIEARQMARGDAERGAADPWEFASQIAGLEAAGISESILRRLVKDELIEHKVETTRRRSTSRTFAPTFNLCFHPRSCFVLSAAGSALASQLTCAPDALLHRRLPHYDGGQRTLYLGEVIVKRFRVPADNQEIILTSFQEEGWPLHLYDPLPRGSEIHPAKRLQDAIFRLNHGQEHRLLHFQGDGKGRGLTWQRIESV